MMVGNSKTREKPAKPRTCCGISILIVHFVDYNGPRHDNGEEDGMPATRVLGCSGMWRNKGEKSILA